MSDVINNTPAPITVSATGDAPPAPITPPAATTPPAPGTPPAPAAQDWTSGLPDDIKGYVQNKGFKDPAQVVGAYREFEKMRGVPQERLLTLPEKEDSPEWGNIYSKLGKPAKPEDYGISAPEGQDPSFATWAKNVFHGANLTTKQAEAIGTKWNEHVAQTNEANKAAYDQRIASEETTLAKEWGAAHGQNIEVAKRAITAFGIDGPTIDKLEGAIGHLQLMKLFQNIGSKLGEDSFVSGNTGKGGFSVMTPAMAKDKIQSLMSDKEWGARYVKGDAQARQEFEHLHKMANPDT